MWFWAVTTRPINWLQRRTKIPAWQLGLLSPSRFIWWLRPTQRLTLRKEYTLAFILIIHSCINGCFVGRDSSVCKATRYGLNRSGIEFRWGARFPAPVQTGPGAHPASYKMGTGSFPREKRPRRDVDHPHTSSAEVEERVELYLYFPSGTSWPVLGWTLSCFYQRMFRITLWSTREHSLMRSFLECTIQRMLWQRNLRLSITLWAFLSLENLR
jgi:hypothetical protein